MILGVVIEINISTVQQFFHAPKNQQEESKMTGNLELNNHSEKMNQDIFECEIDTTDKKITIKSQFTIKNFSLRKENSIESPVFTSKNPGLNDTWSLVINPNLFTSSGFHVSVYLKLLSSKTNELQAKCNLSIITAGNKHSCHCIATNYFTKNNTKFGRNNFMLRHDLLKLKDKYLPGDNLTISSLIDIDINFDTNNVIDNKIINDIQQSIPTSIAPIIQNENQQVSQLNKNPEINKKNSQDALKDVFEYETGVTKSGKKLALKAKFTIKNFSFRQEALITSPEFSSKYPGLNDTWCLDINPKILTTSGHHLGVNLILLSAKDKEELSTRCKLSIITSENEDSCNCTAAHRFSKQKNKFGRNNFMVRHSLFKSKERYLPNDSLTVSCVIELDIHGLIDERFSPNFHPSLHTPQIPTSNKIKKTTPEPNNNNSEKINQDIFNAKASCDDKELTFTSQWTIKNFSLRKEIEISSPKFSLASKFPGLNNYVWRLVINPKLLTHGDFYVGVNLILLSVEADKKLPAKCKLSIITSENEESCSVFKPHIFNKENEKFGKDNFILLHELLKSKDKYLPGDYLTVICMIDIQRNAFDNKIIIPKVEQVVDAPQNEQVEEIVNSPQQHQQVVNVPQQNKKIQQVANAPHYQVPRTHYDHHEYDYHEDYEINDMYAQLLLSRQSTDAIIIVGTKAFPVIKGILAARSPYFSALFKSQEYKNNGKNEIELKDIKSDVFAEILQFIYSDRSPNVDKLALDLLGAADKYKLRKLKDISEKSLLRQKMTFDYAPVLFLKADLYNAVQLRGKALNFIVDNLKNIIHTDTFKSFKDNYDKLFMEILEYAADIIHEYAGTIKHLDLQNLQN